jgi:chemotaxis signal transduction protein
MTQPGTFSTATAAALRREFDRGFAQAPPTQAARFENMLAVRIGGAAYAIRLAEILGLYADRNIVALPTAMPELLGMVRFRGQIAPVYDLAALLGYSVSRAPRWMVVVRQRETVALAFDAFEAQVLVATDRILAAIGDGNDTRPHVHGAVHAHAAVRPLVHLPSVFEDIQRRVQSTHPLNQSAQER